MNNFRLFSKIFCCFYTVIFAHFCFASALVCPIGVVDMETLLTQSIVAQNVNSQLSAMEKDLAQKTKKLEQIIKQEEKQILLKKKSSPRKREILKTLEELKKKNIDYQRNINDTKTKVGQIVYKARKKIHLIVVEIIEEIAKEKNLSIVLPRNLTFFATQSVDITKHVLEKLDKRINSIDVGILGEER